MDSDSSLCPWGDESCDLSQVELASEQKVWLGVQISRKIQTVSTI